MKCSLIVLILCAFLAVCAFAQDIKIVNGECKLADGRVFKVGEKFVLLGECFEYTCKKDGYIVLGCPSVDALEPCSFSPEDNSKPYPECCPQFVC